MRYYKGRWDTPRSDDFASWGGSDWYMEVREDGIAALSLEVYDAGAVLRYDDQTPVTSYHRTPFDQSDGTPSMCVESITQEDFEAAWSTHLTAIFPPLGEWR